MESVKILHTGDLHLCSPMLNMRAKALERKRELMKTFSEIINIAAKENVDALLIAGDMFENSNPDAETLEFISKELERIGHIRVFIVLGNHDFELDCKFPENVHIFGNYIEKVSLKNADIYGVSFDTEHNSRCIIEGFTADSTENINILLVHGDLQAKSMYNPITTDDISYSKMDYIALGHIHSHSGFEISGATTYSYCGIPEGRAFDECGEKGVIIANVGKGYADCRFVPVCSRQYLCQTVDISKAEDNLQIAEQIALQLGNMQNAYRIILTGVKKTFVDAEFLKEYLEKNYYFIEIEDCSEEHSLEENSLKKLFIENCRSEDAVKYGLMALRGEKVIIE